jgi:mannose-1-phosphate guanylyltransferase
MDIPSISIDYAVMERSKNKSGILTIWLVWFGFFESVYDYLVSIGHPVDEKKYGDWNW